MRDIVSLEDAWGEVAISYKLLPYVEYFLRLLGCARHTLMRASYSVINL
mgnify:CR=1 FL=1